MWHHFKRNKVIVGAIDEEWEADLVIMDSLSKANKGYNYILTVIDVLSKFAWVEPIKTKWGENLVKAFEKICKKGRQPEKLHTDKGTEFTNRLFQRFLKDKNILFFTTHNDAQRKDVEILYGKEYDKVYRCSTKVGIFIQLLETS